MLGALSVGLVGSMLLSYALFRQGREYYRQLNGVRRGGTKVAGLLRRFYGDDGIGLCHRLVSGRKLW